MPHISRIPDPSIALVLTADHTHIPRRPSVIKVAATPAPVIKIRPPQHSGTAMGDVDEPLNVKNSIPECHVHPVTSDEDEEHMFLAESICEVPIAEAQEHIVGLKLIKEKISNALFSFRRLLCVDLPQTCFPGVSRQ